MSLYFFDITDFDGFYSDAIGETFKSFKEARRQCQILLRDIIREELPGGDSHIISCALRDEAGRTVYCARMTYQGVYGPE